MKMLKKMTWAVGCLLLYTLTIHAEDIQQEPCCCSTNEEVACEDEEPVSDIGQNDPDRLYEFEEEESDSEYAARCGLTGVWFPEEPVLFHPFIADPRQVTYSVGWRLNDQALVKNVIDVSYGDTCAFYEWVNVWPWNGRLRIELEGALWAVFSPLQYSAPLINADYYCAIPITYAIDRWAFRLRGYHISCHIGDEFLLNHPHFRRRNPSAEYLDFFVSHDLTDDIRVYGGIGWIVDQDKSFINDRFYAEGGAELRLHQLAYISRCNRLYVVPIYGMHFRFRRDFKHHIDATYVLGFEVGKFSGLCRKFRTFLEYHDGYSCEGQFARFATNYISLRFSYGY